nr:reverse transcriptase domain-containing protein [Tanacetum cinerariifolium]
MPSDIKTYDGSEDPEDHLKKFQAAAKIERWAMSTWCRMFNSTLTENVKKQQEGNHKQSFKKGEFQNQQRPKRKQDRFTLLIKTPNEIFALEKGEFKAPPPMTTPVEKRNHTKFCEFHVEVGHNTDECMHLKKQIKEMLKVGKLSHLIKELKQNSGKEPPKTAKKGETSGKDKALAILLVQLWERVARKKITQSFSPNTEILFPPLDEEERTEVQQNYWKTRSQEAASSFVNSSRNAEAPGRRRSNYPKKQQVGPAGIWRMCVDFKDLNKACPKDGYPLPKIDWKVESLCEFPFKCFLEAYKGHHQIQMAKEDEEKIAFITSQGIFFYTKMPLGLRNMGATYQRLVDKAFHKQIGRNLEVYVDDLVMKSRREDEIVRDIEETFKIPREINMKLNPKKCIFGVEEGMFLGYKVNTKGLKVFLDKVDAVLSLSSPKCLKDVQKLNGKLASLNSQRNGKRGPDEEREAKQMPIYFVSKALRGPEINYTSMEKLVLALVHASKRLKRYFQAHPIIVITDQPIQQVLSRPKVAGRLHKWSIELVEYAINYRPRVSVKGQILADFIVERPEDDSLDTLMEVKKELPEPWILFTDESSCTDGSRAGLILTNPEGVEFTSALRFRFELPGEIILDNGKQFQDNPFTDWCEKLCIRQHFASVKHPQTNGLVERANRSLGERIKARLDARSKNWMEELHHILWAHRTMIKSRNRVTTFSLTYGTEAVIPAEIDMPTLRTAEVDLVQNDEALGINLDLLEEKRDQAAIRKAKNKAKMEKYYNSKVRMVNFKSCGRHMEVGPQMGRTVRSYGSTWKGRI